MRTLQRKKIAKDERGSVLVMGIIIASGIVIVGIEFSVFVVNSIRQARNLDSTVTAFYAAESGIESLMHQVRYEGLFQTCDRPTRKRGTIGSASWTVLKDGAQDSGNEGEICGDTTPLSTGVDSRFNNTLSSLEKPLIVQDDSVEFSLYLQNGQEFQAVPNMSKLRVSWMLEEKCQAGERPWLETSVVKWDGGPLQWESTQIKKDFQKASDDVNNKSIVVDLAALDGNDPVLHPMIVRVKLFYCDVKGVQIQLLSQNLDQHGNQIPIPIPNYFTIQPLGSFRGVQYKDLSVTIPKRGAHS
ncbi:MAG: hypothetical protein Q7R79_04550, partial [bacterium]|nr:hypothetical protein [bacterium]